MSANGESCNGEHMSNKDTVIVQQGFLLNECASNGERGPCQQMCSNTVVSYYCSCLPGYTLSANGTSCNGEHMNNIDACQSDV